MAKENELNLDDSVKIITSKKEGVIKHQMGTEEGVNEKWFVISFKDGTNDHYPESSFTKI